MLAINRSKNKYIYPILALSCLLILFSCGGTDPDPDPGSGKGKVALFISDNISFYKQVVATITSVELINSGTDEVCGVLSAPVTLDIANLTDIAQYVGLKECPEGRYNRINIGIKKDVHLMDELGATSSCELTAAYDERGAANPLDCNPASGICTASVRGEERSSGFLVQEDRYNDLGIDFDLKKFSVSDFGGPACAVAMSVETMEAEDLNDSGRSHSITGAISGLDTTAETFTITASGASLSVDYAGIIPALQPNIDILLQTAQDNGLKVNVLTGSIDLETATIPANRVYLKAAGLASNVQGVPWWRFTLTYGPSQTIDGSFFPPADVQGALGDGVWVDVKFKGYSTARGRYVAETVEVLPFGTELDD